MYSILEVFFFYSGPNEEGDLLDQHGHVSAQAEHVSILQRGRYAGHGQAGAFPPPLSGHVLKGQCHLEMLQRKIAHFVYVDHN